MSHAKHLLDRRLGLFCNKKNPMSRNTEIFGGYWLQRYQMQKGFFFFFSIFLHSQVVVTDIRDEAFLSFVIILKNWHGPGNILNGQSGCGNSGFSRQKSSAVWTVAVSRHLASRPKNFVCSLLFTRADATVDGVQPLWKT